MKKLSFLLLLTACITLFNCSPEESESTENTETTAVTTTEVKAEADPEDTPSTAPTPTPTKEEIKQAFHRVSVLKANFEKAIQKKDLDIYHKTKNEWEKEEKNLDLLQEKYGAQAFYNSPIEDCREAFYHMFQAYVVFWGGATNPADDREKRAYEEDRDKLSKLFNECKISAETGKSFVERNPQKEPE